MESDSEPPGAGSEPAQSPDRPTESPANSAGAPAQPIPSLLRNWLSWAGLLLFILVLGNLVLLLLVALLVKRPNPYLGIFVYLALPTIAMLGLLLVPAGVLLERRRRRRLLPGELPRYPRIDLNQPATRRAAAFAAGFIALFLMVSALASYHAYQFTDSVAFCGETCHTPMKPEFIAYQDSPHARVPCANCHIGPGASWFVRSKLTGIYQVYAVATNSYPRPIRTPIKFLRPVREACEECHWPKKFYAAQLKVFSHFMPDEKNTPAEVRMLIKTGGGSAEGGRPMGIHWHMNLAYKVSFVASDPQHQNIPWVRTRNINGRVTEYFAKGSPLTPKQVAAMPKNVMDCVSCHDRPSHRFLPPDFAVDRAFVAGRLERSLPFLKREMVKLLSGSYPSTPKALEAIATGLADFYQDKYPELYAQERLQIEAAIATAQEIYRNNFFPEMRVDWRTHPDNIGHLYYRGCFRCHDGRHVSADGRVISNACESCHTIIGQKVGEPAPASGETFAHPINLKALKGLTCSTCHTGAVL